MDRDFSERLPPSNNDAEMALLGTILAGSETSLTDAEAILHTVDVFYNPVHRKVYLLLLKMRDAGKGTDLVHFFDEASRTGLLDELGGGDRQQGQAYIVDLAQSYADPDGAEGYARTVNEYWRRRECLRIGHDLIKKSQNLMLEIDETASVAATALDRTVEAADQNIFTAQELLDQYPAQLVGESDKPPVPTHLQEYDLEYGGLPRGSLFILGARPSCGKSTLALQWCVLAARAGFPSLFVSVEMSRSMMNERLTCHLGCKARQVLRRMGKADLEGVCGVAKSHLAGGYLGVVLGKNRIREIVSMIRSLTRKHGLALVVVDYLQLCRVDQKGDRRDLDVAEMTADLKASAIENDVAMVVCAQLNRKVETEGREPGLADLRESGSIEQDADIVGFLHREKTHGQWTDKNGVSLLIRKYRNGPLNQYDLEYQHEVYRMRTRGFDDGWGLCTPASGKAAGGGEPERHSKSALLPPIAHASDLTPDVDCPF